MDVLYHKSGRTDYARHTGLPPPSFLTFRRPCIRVERRRRPRSWPWSVTRNDYECSVNKRFLLLDELVDVVVAEILSIDEMYIVCTTTYTVHRYKGSSINDVPIFSWRGQKFRNDLWLWGVKWDTEVELFLRWLSKWSLDIIFSPRNLKDLQIGSILLSESLNLTAKCFQFWVSWPTNEVQWPFWKSP